MSVLNDLEERVDALEKQLLSKDADEKLGMASWKNIDETINTFAKKRERFRQIFNKASTIEEYLKPGFIDIVSHNATVEREVILSSEEEVKEMCSQLEQIDECAKCLSSDETIQVLHHKPKLAQLKMVQQQQIEKVSNLSEDLRQLLLGYNELVTNVSERFAVWDECLCKIEEKKEKEGR